MMTMQPIERIAALLMPSEMMLNWINENTGEEEALTLEEIQGDATVILLPIFEDEEQTEDYLNQIYSDLFESELASWEEDEAYWPKDRSLEMFLEWFNIEFHSIVYDVGKGIIASQNRKTMLQ